MRPPSYMQSVVDRYVVIRRDYIHILYICVCVLRNVRAGIKIGEHSLGTIFKQTIMQY